METSALKQPVPVASVPETRTPVTPESVAKTELPASETVQPSEDAQATAPEDNRQPPVRPQQSENLVEVMEQDSETNTTIYRTVDTRTGLVKEQMPTETILKLKAYAKAVNGLDASNFSSVRRTA
ncbi:MAG: hypothetical protein ABJN26_21890 [Stappiaceae bacterium]